MNYGNLRLAAVLVLSALLTGCDNSSPTPPEPGQFSLALQDLPPLASNHYYEAWIGFPEDGSNGLARLPSTLHEDIEHVTLGAFRVAENGEITALDGQAVSFHLAESRDLSLAVEILIAVQAEGDSLPGPFLLGGAVTEGNRTGVAELSTSHSDALDAGLTQVGGTFVLATPSDGLGTNETRGIWFANLTTVPPTPSLELPQLGDGWLYQAWVKHRGEFLSLGRIVDVATPDSDGKGPGAGPQDGFELPGSDFVQDALNLADGRSEVFIALVDNRHEDGQTGPQHGGPFPLQVLSARIPAGGPPRRSLRLSTPTAPLPSGTVTFTR
jgi:hypothetical protein